MVRGDGCGAWVFKAKVGFLAPLRLRVFALKLSVRENEISKGILEAAKPSRLVGTCVLVGLVHLGNLRYLDSLRFLPFHSVECVGIFR